MKHILLSFVLFISISVSFAQKKIEKTIGEFTEIKVFDLIKLELIKSDSKVDKVVITGENAEDVQVINKDGKIKLRMRLKEIFDGNKTKIVLYYTNIDVIDANEGAEIFSKDGITQYEIELRAQEGGRVTLSNIETTYTTVKANTGGIIETTGSSEKLKVSLSTGAIYEGKAHLSKNAEVSIKAAGEAFVNASDLVDVNVRIGGDVYIYGSPKKVIENMMIGGRIKYVE